VPAKAKVSRDIVVAKHKFKLEIYLALEGHDDISWEIFPHGYDACLYAFSNKKRLEKIIKQKHIYEDTKVRSTN
jgi:hypothetical protein